MVRTKLSASAITILHDKPTFSIITKARITQAVPENNSPARTKCKTIRCIWDTGATSSAISTRLARALRLKASGQLVSYTANGAMNCMLYYVNVQMPNGITFTRVRASGVNLSSTVDMLIGMDVITTGDFAITNHKGKTCMSFRAPSKERIDFVSRG